jgi:thimet oligopeptidase
MQYLKKLGILLLLMPAAAMAQNSMLTNPLLVHSNSPLQFTKFDTTVIKDATSTLIKTTDARVKRLVAIPAGKKTVANTLMAFDELSYDLADLGNKLSLVASTYSDDGARNEANEQHTAATFF